MMVGSREVIRWFCSLVVALSLTGAGATAVQPEQDAGRVQQDVKALAHALYSGDVAMVMRYTHPTVIALQGGTEAARKAVQDVLLKTTSAGIRLESFTFPKPPEFLEGGGRRFAVVPTLSIIEANGQRIESLNFQLGVLDSGAAGWTYVEGSRLTKENVQALFPGFPASYEFPAFYRKKLEPKSPPAN